MRLDMSIETNEILQGRTRRARLQKEEPHARDVDCNLRSFFWFQPFSDTTLKESVTLRSGRASLEKTQLGEFRYRLV